MCYPRQQNRSQHVNSGKLRVIQKRAAAVATESLLPLKSLKRLMLGGSEISDEGMKTVAQLKSLEELDVTSFEITPKGLREITALPALRMIGVKAYTCLTPDGCKLLRQMQHLTAIKLDCMPGSVEGIDQLPAIDDLRIVTFTVDGGEFGSQLSFIAKLIHLKSLDLQRTTMTDADISQLVELKALQRLVLPDTVSKCGAASVQKILPQPGLSVFIGPEEIK